VKPRDILKAKETLVKSAYCVTEYAISSLLLRILSLTNSVAQWLKCYASNPKVAGSIPAGVSGFFIATKSFWSHYDPEVDSASNRNEYQ